MSSAKRASSGIAFAASAAARSRAVRVAESFGSTVFSAGGASIYAQTIPLADTMYLSYIKGRYTGDAYFPEFSDEEWAVERREDHPRFEFVVYQRLVRSVRLYADRDRT